MSKSFENDCTMLEVSGEIPRNRSSYTVNVVKDNVYLFGGVVGDNSCNDLYVLQTDKMKWEKLVIENPPPIRKYVRILLLLFILI